MAANKVTNVKAIKAPKSAHTPNSKKGMGDFYGTGVKNPVGKQGSGSSMPKIKSKTVGRAPRALG